MGGGDQDHNYVSNMFSIMVDLNRRKQKDATGSE